MSVRIGKSGPVTIGASKKRTMKQFLKDTGYRFSQYNGWANCPITSFKGVLEYDDTPQINNTYALFWGFDKLEEVPSLNITGASFFGQTFNGCKSLKKVPYFDTSSVERWEYCFNNCASLEYIHPLDTSKGTRFPCTFRNCSKLKDLSWLDTSSNTYASMDSTFFNCTSLTSLPDTITTTNVTSLANMFAGCYVLEKIPNLTDTSKVTSFYATFHNCRKIKTIPEIDTSSATSMCYIFYNDYALEELPYMNTSKVKDFTYAFRNCSALKAVPELDYSSATTLNYAFFGDKALTSMPAMNTPNCKVFHNTFNSCTNLKRIESIDFTGATDTVSNCFGGCANLEYVNIKGPIVSDNIANLFGGCRKLPDSCFPTVDVSKVKYIWWSYANCLLLEDLRWINGPPPLVADSVNGCFYNCPKLKEIPEMDWSNATSYNDYEVFGFDYELTAIHVKNFPLSFDIHWSTKLDHDALVEIIGNLMDKTGGKTQTLKLGSTLKAKLSAEEIKVATDKNWTVV